MFDAHAHPEAIIDNAFVCSASTSDYDNLCPFRYKAIGTLPESSTPPDFSIMERNSFNYDTLLNRFRELSYLNKGIRIEFEDTRGDLVRKDTLHAEGGLSSFVKYLNEYKTTLFDPISFEGVRKIEQNKDVSVEVALQYNDKYDEKIYTFVNKLFQDV